MSSSGDYRPPSDPWGKAPDAWDPAAGAWGRPPGPPGAPVREPGHTEPPYPPPLPRRSLGLYAVVAVLVLLAAAGVGYALYLLSGEDGDPGAGGNPGPTSTAATTGTPGSSASPSDNIGLSAAVAAVDDCLVNDGTTDQTQMRIVRCDDGEPAAGTVVFRVLAVLDERVAGEDDDSRHNSAQAACASTEGYTHHYFEIGDESSFVLCMSEEEPEPEQDQDQE